MGDVLNPSAKIQSAYSISPTDWTVTGLCVDITTEASGHLFQKEIVLAVLDFDLMIL